MAEVPARAVDRPGFAILLVETDHQPLALLAQVTLALGVHHVRQFLAALVNLRDIVGGEVLVLHRVQRQVDAGKPADFSRPQAGRVDQLLGDYRALLGNHFPAAVGARVGLQHAVAQHDLGTLQLRRLRVSLRGAGGIEMPVERIVEPAEHAVGVGDRAQGANLRGRDQLGIETHVAVHGARRLEEIEAFRRLGERDAADVMQAAGLAGDFLELAVEPNRVALQRRHVGIRVQRMKTAGRVPGRARRQLRAFDQQHVPDTEFRQVVDDAATDHATTDDYYLCMTFHNKCIPFAWCLDCRIRAPAARLAARNRAAGSGAANAWPLLAVTATSPAVVRGKPAFRAGAPPPGESGRRSGRSACECD